MTYKRTEEKAAQRLGEHQCTCNKNTNKRGFVCGNNNV